MPDLDISDLGISDLNMSDLDIIKNIILSDNLIQNIVDNQFLLDIIFDYILLKDYANLLIINKDYNIFFRNIDDYLWSKIAINEYSKEFWTKAIQRDIRISKPLKNYKEELKRLKLFEHSMQISLQKKFTINDYYRYWDTQDKFLKKSIETKKKL